MSRSLNRIILVGNVGRDPEIRTTSAGTKMVRVSLEIVAHEVLIVGDLRPKTHAVA